jgi:hypothetical protein
MSSHSLTCSMAARGPDLRTAGKNFHSVVMTSGSNRSAAAGSPAVP